jgi:hypothetical protein
MPPILPYGVVWTFTQGGAEMAYETGAPPPPEHTPIEVETVQHRPDDPLVPALRPAAGYDATTAIVGLAGPPPGTTTYRLHATETTEIND